MKFVIKYALLLVLISLASKTLAAPMTYDSSTTVNIQDGTSYTWTTGQKNWFDTSRPGQSGKKESWATGDSASFGLGLSGTAGTVSLGSNISSNSITFNQPFLGNYNISTGSYTLSVQNGISTNYSTSITGNLILTGNQSITTAQTQILTTTSIANNSSLIISGQGTLKTQNINGTGSLILSSGSILDINGQITQNSITTQAGSFLSIDGSSIGIATLNGSTVLAGTYLFDANYSSLTADKLVVNGQTNLNGLDFHLNSAIGSYESGAHYMIKLLSVNGNTTGTFTFSGLNNDQSVVRHGNDFYLIPQPSSFLLLGLGCILMFRRPKRNKSVKGKVVV